ncbi:MAG: hypothetical protein AAB268_13955 [Elusimicrobiota bacterium]
MVNDEDVKRASHGPPAAEIPDLKKKENERKKAGAGWSGVKPGGGSFSGATGGTIARAAASATGTAAVEAAGGGWLAAMIARLTATVLGKALLAAGAATFLAGAGLFAYAMFKGGGSGPGVGGDLGAISSSVKVRGDGADRTGYVASNGEIRFDPLKAAEVKKAPEDNAAQEPVAPAQSEGADLKQPGLEHNLSGSKLTASLGSGFGGNNIFAGNSSAPKLNEMLSKVSIKGASNGKISAMRYAKTGRVAAGRRGKSMKGNKAFGQLKVAKGLSVQGVGASAAEGARSTAATAFDGQTESGTGNVTGEADGSVTPNDNFGAPDVTAPNVDTPEGAATDTFTDDMLSSIASMAKSAGQMKMMAGILMIVGIALIAAGIALLATGFGALIGGILIGLGAMIIGISIMMSQMAKQMKELADMMSEALAASTGDINQEATSKYCIDKAYNEGTDVEDCNPPEEVTEGEKFDTDDIKVVEEHKEMVKETGEVVETQ